MKKIIIPNSLKQIRDTLKYAEAYLIGINNLSVNLPVYFKLEEIEEIKNIIRDKELFISLNKNMRNSDLENVEKTLKALESLNIKGIFYYDISVLSIVKRLNLDIDLVWSQEHATTNYSTINYWNNLGATYTYLSNEITKEEILQIKNNTNSKLIVQVFGYITMFNSKRHLITNYLKYFKLDSNDKIYYMEKENNKYPVIDTYDGTEVYTSKLLNAFDEYLEFESNNIEYACFNSFLIDDDKFIEVLRNYDEGINKVDIILGYNTFEGFMNTKTVYKVK